MVAEPCWCRELATTPLLVLANKIDLSPHLTEQELIKGEGGACALMRWWGVRWLTFSVCCRNEP
jgi:hypothetical protein